MVSLSVRLLAWFPGANKVQSLMRIKCMPESWPSRLVTAGVSESVLRQVIDLLAGAVGGLHTMRDEHFGISVVQYMAAGAWPFLSSSLIHQVLSSMCL